MKIEPMADVAEIENAVAEAVLRFIAAGNSESKEPDVVMEKGKMVAGISHRTRRKAIEAGKKG